MKKPETLAQKIWGKDFGNAPILNERPEGMDFNTYKRRRRVQTHNIKVALKLGSFGLKFQP